MMAITSTASTIDSTMAALRSHPAMTGEDLRLIADEDGVAKAKSLDALR